jgi:hypothetical protein
MFRLTKLRHNSFAIGNRFCHKLANRPLTLGDSFHAILGKTVLIEHYLILLLSWFIELRAAVTGVATTAAQEKTRVRRDR